MADDHGRVVHELARCAVVGEAPQGLGSHSTQLSRRCLDGQRVVGAQLRAVRQVTVDLRDREVQRAHVIHVLIGEALPPRAPLARAGPVQLIAEAPLGVRSHLAGAGKRVPLGDGCSGQQQAAADSCRCTAAPARRHDHRQSTPPAPEGGAQGPGAPGGAWMGL